MSGNAPDARTEDIRILDAEEKTAGMSEMVDWMLRVLSGGSVEAYAMDVMKRAEEKTAEASA